MPASLALAGKTMQPILPTTLVVLVALSFALPPASALHAGDSRRAEEACSGTVCVTLTIAIYAGNCAFLPLGTPCDVAIHGSVGGSSVLGGSAAGGINGAGSASCSWSALGGSCSGWIHDTWWSSYRGQWVCATGSASAQDALNTATVSFTHCYEAH